VGIRKRAARQRRSIIQPRVARKELSSVNAHSPTNQGRVGDPSPYVTRHWARVSFAQCVRCRTYHLRHSLTNAQPNNTKPPNMQVYASQFARNCQRASCSVNGRPSGLRTTSPAAVRTGRKTRTGLMKSTVPTNRQKLRTSNVIVLGARIFIPLNIAPAKEACP